jgi:hypothetical protein
VKVRAAIGAGVSFGDMLSDVYMVDVYFTTGRMGTANSLLAMVGANIAYQLGLIFLQTYNLKRNKWKTILFEILSVVTFTKPGKTVPSLNLVRPNLLTLSSQASTRTG